LRQTVKTFSVSFSERKCLQSFIVKSALKEAESRVVKKLLQFETKKSLRFTEQSFFTYLFANLKKFLPPFEVINHVVNFNWMLIVQTKNKRNYKMSEQLFSWNKIGLPLSNPWFTNIILPNEIAIYASNKLIHFSG